MPGVVLKLFFIGHLLGDYYLQSEELATSKNKSLKKLLKHSVIYLIAICFAIIPIFSLNMLKWAFIISVSHFILDFVKYLILKRNIKGNKTKLLIYLFDQLLHILALILVTAIICILAEPVDFIYIIQYGITSFQIDVVNIISWILMILVIIRPCSVTIKNILNNFKPGSGEEEGSQETGSDSEKESQRSAGATIGILERCIILLLLSVGQYSAIGFVLTAKSIARYNKIAEDPAFSEYYLLGTLLSVMLVVASYLIIFQ